MSQGRLFFAGGCLLALTMLFVGCRGDGARTAPEPTGSTVPDSDSPYDPQAEMRPDWMRVEPGIARPGEIVELHFPEETERGVGFVLEERVGPGWVLRFYLTSDPQQPTWGKAGEDYAWDDLGVEGPGPDRAMVPPGARPGDYRICTANALMNFCAPLQVVADD